MQYSQPFSGTSGHAGYPWQYGSSYPCNYAYPSVPQPPMYPEIIGEGEVASVAFPDGSVHMYFIPSRRSPPPCTTTNSQYCDNIGAYYVRDIYPKSLALFNQQCQKIPAGPHSRPFYTTDENYNRPLPAFQLKFHNDNWTSTTDLHYFFPYKRGPDWIPLTQPKQYASVQVETPANESPTNHQEMVCAKPCLCFQNKDKHRESLDECHCMRHTRSANCIKYKHGRKTKSLSCECHEVTRDAAVATVADEACGCDVNNERVTQTAAHVKRNRWKPKKSKDMEIKSSEEIDLRRTRSSTTCSCSDADDYRMVF